MSPPPLAGLPFYLPANILLQEKQKEAINKLKELSKVKERKIILKQLRKENDLRKAEEKAEVNEGEEPLEALINKNH